MPKISLTPEQRTQLNEKIVAVLRKQNPTVAEKVAKRLLEIAQNKESKDT